VSYFQLIRNLFFLMAVLSIVNLPLYLAYGEHDAIN
jgi:hypothetical protein